MAKKIHPEWQRGYNFGYAACRDQFVRHGEPMVQWGLECLVRDQHDAFDRGYYAGYKNAYDNRHKDRTCTTTNLAN